MSDFNRQSFSLLSQEQIKRYIDSKEAEHCPRCGGTNLDFGAPIFDGAVVVEPRACNTCDLEFSIKAEIKGLSDDSFYYRGKKFNATRPEFGKPYHMSIPRFLEAHGQKCPVCKGEAERDTSEYNCIGHTFFYSFGCSDPNCGATWEAFYKTDTVISIVNPKVPSRKIEENHIAQRSNIVGPKTAKKQAKACKQFLDDKGHEVQLSVCQEMVAQAVHGARNWSTLLGGVATNVAEFVKEDIRPMNIRRAGWAYEALEAFGDSTGVYPNWKDAGETQSAIKDMLCNLRHLCDVQGIDFHHLSLIAEGWYHDEANDDDENSLGPFRLNGFKASDMAEIISLCERPEQVIDSLFMVSDDETIRVEWKNLGEGYNGDCDKEDPDDMPLLRFDVSAKACAKTAHLFMDDVDEGEWGAVHDASYCTNMPATASPEILIRALKVILDECERAVDGGGQVKKPCESLSWIGPDDFKK